MHSIDTEIESPGRKAVRARCFVENFRGNGVIDPARTDDERVEFILVLCEEFQLRRNAFWNRRRQENVQEKARGHERDQRDGHAYESVNHGCSVSFHRILAVLESRFRRSFLLPRSQTSFGNAVVLETLFPSPETRNRASPPNAFPNRVWERGKPIQAGHKRSHRTRNGRVSASCC